jgi:hypothetical protein
LTFWVGEQTLGLRREPQGCQNGDPQRAPSQPSRDSSCLHPARTPFTNFLNTLALPSQDRRLTDIRHLPIDHSTPTIRTRGRRIGIDTHLDRLARHSTTQGSAQRRSDRQNKTAQWPSSLNPKSTATRPAPDTQKTKTRKIAQKSRQAVSVRTLRAIPTRRRRHRQEAPAIRLAVLGGMDR